MFLVSQRSFGMQQTVRLLGDLGERYGSEHKYHDLQTPAHAIKLLCINKPEFQKELLEAHKHGIGYTLVQADELLGQEDLHLPLGQNDLVLAPVVMGSGGSIGKIFIGVALVIGSFIPGVGALAASAMFSLGAGLALQGTAELLAPQPVIPSFGGRRTSPGENTNATGPQGVSRAVSGQQSYAFSGPANTVGIGSTVPLVYGKLLVGSHLISAKVEVAEESDPTSAFFIAPGASTITVNSEKPGNSFKSHNGLRTRKWTDNVIRLGDKETDNNRGWFRRTSNKSLRFDEAGESENISDFRDFSQDDEEFGNFQVFFEIDKGLGRQIGSKTVPAFVTYEITVKKDQYKGDSPVFCNVRGTIQGLLASGDNYRWCHALTIGYADVEKNETTARVKFRILDTDADSNNGRIRIRGAGYNHFIKSSQNNTDNLVSEA